MTNGFSFILFFSFSVVPPEVPKIQDSSGFELPAHAGPYEEGGILELTCVVRGGKYCDVEFLVSIC